MNLQQIDVSYREATSMFEQGEITKEEYLNFLRGFEIEQAVTMNAEEMQQKEQLHTAITSAISIVSALA